MDLRSAAAFATGLLGLSFLVGYFKNFRERLYLLLLGLSFLALAGAMLIPSAKEMQPPMPALIGLKIGLLALAGVLFVGAVAFAVRETRQQIRLIQERRAGLERQMCEYLEQLKKQQAEQQGEAPDESAPASEEKEGPDA